MFLHIDILSCVQAFAPGCIRRKRRCMVAAVDFRVCYLKIHYFVLNTLSLKKKYFVPLMALSKYSGTWISFYNVCMCVGSVSERSTAATYTCNILVVHCKCAQRSLINN